MQFSDRRPVVRGKMLALFVILFYKSSSALSSLNVRKGIMQCVVLVFTCENKNSHLKISGFITDSGTNIIDHRRRLALQRGVVLGWHEDADAFFNHSFDCSAYYFYNILRHATRSFILSIILIRP